MNLDLPRAARRAPALRAAVVAAALTTARAPIWRRLLPWAILMALAGALVRGFTRQAERLYPPTGRFIDVNGVRLHYLDVGDGPPVVLLHGDGTMAAEMSASGLVDALAQNHRVLVLDRPGYGYSQRPRGWFLWTPQAQARLLRQALAQLGVQRPVVLGHSWGTTVAVSLALLDPAHVKRLVLISGYYFPTLRIDGALLATPAIPIVGDLMRATISPLLGRLLWRPLWRLMFSPAPLTARFERLPKWLMLRPGQLRAAAAEAAMMVPASIALRRQYGRLAMPVTIIAGRDDRFVSSRAHSVRLHRHLPQSTLHLVPGAGHMVHHSAPQVVLAAIDDEAQDSAATTAAARLQRDTSLAATPAVN